MSAKLATTVARDLQSLFTIGVVAGRTDGQLVEQFLTGSGDAAEAAFEALVRRHGPMVLRVCQQILRDEHDSQDAFQATFLLLVRKAGTVRKQGIGRELAVWRGPPCRLASQGRLGAETKP